MAEQQVKPIVQQAPPPSPINFTLAAAKKVKSLMDEENDQTLKLRVFIIGGGCSGFRYEFAFTKSANDDDTTIRRTIEDDDDGSSGGTVELVVDPMSFQYLAGADIDYVEDLSGSQFVIRNPNAKTTCGCGSSFSI